MWKLSWTSILGLLIFLAVCKVTSDLFWFWAELVTVPGALGLGWVGLGLLVRLAIQVVTFPKSFYYFRRETEVDIMTVVSARWIALLNLFSEILTDEDEKDSLFGEEVKALREIKGKVENMLGVLSLLVQRKQSTRSNLKLQKLFSNLKTACCQVTVNSSNVTLWDALDTHSSIKGVSFEGIFPAIDQLSDAMKENLSGDTWKVWLQRWFFNKSLGTLDYMRSELEVTMKGEQVWVLADDGAKIDCMWFQGSPSKAVLLCGGNGFLYECGVYMSDSFLNYVQMGFSVMMWNYRGYGRTKGWPSPSNLMMDGVKVAEYVFKVKNVPKLVVHGESMGGMVACHVAARQPVSLLFADRTFASIEQIAATYTPKARPILRALTQWNTDVVTDYVSAKCFKMLSCDPHDNIIPEMASLKNGVAYRLVRGR